MIIRATCYTNSNCHRNQLFHKIFKTMPLYAILKIQNFQLGSKIQRNYIKIFDLTQLFPIALKKDSKQRIQRFPIFLEQRRSFSITDYLVLSGFHHLIHTIYLCYILFQVRFSGESKFNTKFGRSAGCQWAYRGPFNANSTYCGDFYFETYKKHM